MLAAIQKDLFTEEGYAIVRQVVRLLAERRRNRQPDLAKTKARLADVEKAIANLLDAIKQGVVTVSTKAELVKLEQEQQRLRETLQQRGPKVDVAEFVPDTLGRFKAALADVTLVTQHSMDKARGPAQGPAGGTDLPAPDGGWGQTLPDRRGVR